MSKLIEVASAEKGIAEIVGSEHNPRILQYAKEAGYLTVKDDETGWCTIFLSWVAKQAGYEHAVGSSASWLKVGEAVTEPQKGDVIIFSNPKYGGYYHVGLFVDFTPDKKFVICLGGNQSNQVKETKFAIADVAAYRRLRQVNPPIEPIKKEEKPKEDTKKEEVSKQDSQKNTTLRIPKKKFKLGDKETDIKELQQALQAAGYNCGIPDGDFDLDTDHAIRKFQQDVGIRVTGKSTYKTRVKLAEKLGLEKEGLLDFIFDSDD